MKGCCKGYRRGIRKRVRFIHRRLRPCDDPDTGHVTLPDPTLARERARLVDAFLLPIYTHCAPTPATTTAATTTTGHSSSQSVCARSTPSNGQSGSGWVLQRLHLPYSTLVHEWIYYTYPHHFLSPTHDSVSSPLFLYRVSWLTERSYGRQIINFISIINIRNNIFFMILQESCIS